MRSARVSRPRCPTASTHTEALGMRPGGDRRRWRTRCTARGGGHRAAHGGTEARNRASSALPTCCERLNDALERRERRGPAPAHHRPVSGGAWSMNSRIRRPTSTASSTCCTGSPTTTRRMGLFLIGDPKQSIYGFRGADIHSYLAARRATDGPPLPAGHQLPLDGAAGGGRQPACSCTPRARDPVPPAPSASASVARQSAAVRRGRRARAAPSTWWAPAAPLPALLAACSQR